VRFKKKNPSKYSKLHPSDGTIFVPPQCKLITDLSSALKELRNRVVGVRTVN
jgi:hypothetical protein